MKLPFLLLFIVGLYFQTVSTSNESEDFYKLLGVPRDANLKEIRKAFKTLAVKLHPDKNKDDKEADNKFIKLAKAYEALKDPDARKRYDLYGDTDSNKKQHYHSYTYYRDQFGIYDDDPLIVTLSRSDYEVNVLDNDQAWFVNFYSPNCHHCHDLAPDWRKLATELEGVIRIAAVNCEDDWSLCYQLSIESYPSLLYYAKEANMHEGEPYTGPRNFESLKRFVLSKLTVDIKQIRYSDWVDGDLNKKHWLLFLCDSENESRNCPERDTQLKLATILEGLMPVGIIVDKKLSLKISATYNTYLVVYWEIKETIETVHNIEGVDSKEILDNILNILPNPETIDEKKFQIIRTELRSGSEKPWLICFYLGAATELNLQLRRLPALLPNINIGLIHCGQSSSLCSTLHVPRYPAWGTIKVGGAFELHLGRDILHEIVTFAKSSVKSTNLHALSPADFNNLINTGSPWFIDWYAPWCPPCKKLLPELRKASQHFNSNKIQFGTIDCTLHRNLCTKEGISSYPTTILYNASQINKFHGVPTEEGIVEFVKDLINPVVISLDESSFIQLAKKSKKQLWMVDFYAPWCGPCQRLSPEWRRLAKQMKQFTEVKIAQVDCVANYKLCSEQNIKGYPTIRLYPLGSKGLNTVAMYNGNRDMLSMMRWALSFLPSSVTSLTSQEFKNQILTKRFVLPWLIDFYAPWCGHCTHFEPIFRNIARRLEGRVRCGKIDCEVDRLFCGNLYVQSYPTVMLYLSSNERHEITSRDASEIVRNVESIIAKSRNNYHDEL